MHACKVGISIRLAVGTLEIVVLAQMVGLQLLLKGLVTRLGVDGLFLKNGQDAWWRDIVFLVASL